MKSLLTRLSHLLDRKQKKNFVFLIVVSLFSALLETVSLGAVFALVMAVLSPDAEQGKVLTFLRGYFPNAQNLTAILGGMVIAAYALKSLLSIGLSYARASISLGQHQYFAERLFTRYLHRPWTFFLEENASTLVQRISGQTNVLALYVFNELAIVFAELAVVVCIVGFLTYLNPQVIFGFVGVIAITAILLYATMRKKSRQLGIARLTNEKIAFKTLDITFSGIKEIALNHSHDYFQERFAHHQGKTVRANILITSLKEIPRFVIEFVVVSSFLVLLALLQQQGTPLEVVLSTAAVFAAASFRLLPSMNRFSQAAYHLRVGIPIFKELYEDLRLDQPEPTARVAQTIAPAFNKTLALNNICFSYPKTDRLALEGVTLTVEKNQSIGIIGRTGAGKTTFVELLTGLLTPSTGEILLDGVPLTAHHLQSWQERLGYVPQQIFLYDDTIAKNIAFGIQEADIDMEKVRYAAKLACIASFIEDLPAGYQTSVGDRGVKLSGGQRQRLGIARALYRDPEILIFDEATSALDTATEQAISEALKNLAGQKTVFLIAHRLSTIEHCDQIVLLEQGRIEDKGTYAALQQRSKAFQALHHSGVDNKAA